MTRFPMSAAFLILPLLTGLPLGSVRLEVRDRPRQGTVTIPSDAELNRLEREAITTPPLDVSGSPPRNGKAARDRPKDQSRVRRERRIEQTAPSRGSACDDC